MQDAVCGECDRRWIRTAVDGGWSDWRPADNLDSMAEEDRRSYLHRMVNELTVPPRYAMRGGTCVGA